MTQTKVLRSKDAKGSRKSPSTIPEKPTQGYTYVQHSLSLGIKFRKRSSSIIRAFSDAD